MIEDHHESNEKNEYEEDTDYYYNNALKVNIKQDPASSRHRSRIPIGKLQLENESDIPEKPKEILHEPNNKQLEKDLKAIDDQIAHHYKSIDTLEEQIKNEKFGDNPEITRITKEKDELKEARKPVETEIDSLNLLLKKPKEDLANLKASKESIAKEIDVFKIEVLNSEIKFIQERLAFASLSLGEEKKLIDRKNRLQGQKPKVQKYCELIAQIKTIHDSNEVVFTKLKVLYEKKNTMSEKIKKFSEKIKNYLDTKKQNDPKVNQLKEQKKNIRGEITKLEDKKYELKAENDEKWKNYKDQQRLLKYIKDAEEKIAYLKQKEEKHRKWKERQEKENADAQAQASAAALAQTKTVVEDPFVYEIWLCEWLANYFRNLNGEKNESQSTQGNQQNTQNNSKIDEDIKKGIIKPFVKVEEEIGLAESASKKKSKAPKVSKREQKAVSTNLLCLDIGIIKKINDVGLAPPVKKTDIPSFISQLQKTEVSYKLKADAIKNPQKVTESHPEVNAVAAQQEPVHEPVHEQVHEQVHEPVHEQVHEPVHEQVHEPVHEQVHVPVHEPVHESVHEPVHEQVHEPVEHHEPVHEVHKEQVAEEVKENTHSTTHVASEEHPSENGEHH